MSFVTLYTRSQPAPREILQGVASPFDWRIEVDGVATDATNITAFVYDGSTLLETLSPVSSGGTITATVSAGTTSSVGLMTWLTLSLAYTAGGRAWQTKERVLVVDQILNAAAPYNWITEAVYQLGDPDNLPLTGDGAGTKQDNWSPQSERAYFELLQRMKGQGLHRHPSLLADPSAMVPLIHHEMRMALIYTHLASRLSQSAFYYGLATKAEEKAERLFGKMETAYRSLGATVEWPGGGDVNRSETARRPISLRRRDAYGTGRM